MKNDRAPSALLLSLIALLILISLVCLVLTIGCKTKAPETAEVAKYIPPAGVHLIQNKDSVLKPGEPLLVPMSREPFRLIFPVQDYNEENREFHSARVLATNNPLLIDRFRNGISVDQFEPFSPGSGMAAKENGYTELFVTDYGHHYIIWDSKNPDNRRAQLLGDRDGKHVLSWEINQINYRKKSYPVQTVPAKGFTLIIFIDDDLDGYADPGEWYVADLRFTEF